MGLIIYYDFEKPPIGPVAGIGVGFASGVATGLITKRVEYGLLVGGITGVISGLLGHYLTENTVFDKSGHNIHGWMHGARRVDGLLWFDGRAYVEIPHSPLLNIRRAITLETAIKIAGRTDRDMYLVTKGEALSSMGLGSGTGKYGISLRIGGEWYPLRSERLWWDDIGKWVHIIGTYDSEEGIAKLYLDGELENSMRQTGLLDVNEEPLLLGMFFYGFMDFFRLYDQPTTDEGATRLFEEWKSTRRVS